MPVKPGYLLLAGGGAVFIWSGLRGKSVTGVFRALIGGYDPKNQPTTNPIAGTPQNPTPGAPANASPLVSPGGVPPASSSESDWIKAFLKLIGAPATQANMDSVTAWIRHENPWPPAAANNPLNTTYSGGSNGSVNSVGVKTYPTAAIGLGATAATILGGGYSDILLALRSGRGLCGQSFNGLCTWSGCSGGGGYTSVC